MFLRRTSIPAAAFLAVAATAAALTVANQGGGSAAAGAPGGPAAEAGSFGLLRAAATPAAHHPFAGSQAGGLGVDSATERHTAHGGRDFWAASGASRICVAATSEFEPGSYAGACAGSADAATDGVVATSHPSPGTVAREGLAAGTTEVVALVPDGVSQVSVTEADGAKRTVPVTGNTAAASFDGRPASLEFSGPAGTHRVSLAKAG
jgi:hypothetical protein